MQVPLAGMDQIDHSHQECSIQEGLLVSLLELRVMMDHWIDLFRQGDLAVVDHLFQTQLEEPLILLHPIDQVV
jgi:hypothetical protein